MVVCVLVVFLGATEVRAVVSNEELLSYLDSGVLSLARDYFGDRGECDLQILECLKFLYLMSSDTSLIQGFLPVSQEVDDVWHYFIIQTREYESFCKRLPGSFFIHHKSIHFSIYAQTRDRSSIIRDFIKWIRPYSRLFGGFNEKTANYWIAPKFVCKALNVTPQQLATRLGIR